MLRLLLKKTGDIYLSDMCRMGGFFIRGRLVESKLLSRKYEGLVFFDHKPYHVYIKYGFYSGAKITGIAVPYYPDFEAAYHAGGDLSRTYRKLFKEDINSVSSRRKMMNFYSLLTQIIALAACFLYFEQMRRVMAEGMNSIAMILGILYPCIAALCYYARAKCQ